MTIQPMIENSSEPIEPVGRPLTTSTGRFGVAMVDVDWETFQRLDDAKSLRIDVVDRAGLRARRSVGAYFDIGHLGIDVETCPGDFGHKRPVVLLASGGHVLHASHQTHGEGFRRQFHPQLRQDRRHVQAPPSPLLDVHGFRDTLNLATIPHSPTI